MPRATFERTKPQVSVCTIGEVGHGKTTLTAALTKVLGHKQGGHSQWNDETGRVEYDTQARHYVHVDCPGDGDHVKRMFTSAEPMDGAILVVSAIDGPQPRTRDHIQLGRKAGVPRIVVFLNKIDMVVDPEVTELVEAQVRALLSKCGYEGEDTPVIHGSALAALESVDGAEQVIDLAARMDSHIPGKAP